MRGEEGRRRWFGLAVVGISAGKVPDPRHILLEPAEFSTVFMAEKRRFPARVAKFFWAAFFLGHQASCLSVVVEDESTAVAEPDLFGLPDGTLVEEVGLGAGGFPFLVELVQVRVVIRDPFLDGLPGWLDGLHRLIRPPRPAASPFGLRLRLHPKRLRSLGVVQCRRAVGAGVEAG